MEYALIGFLIEESSHGYALRNRISKGLGPLWHIASSQLYHVLHRLEHRGEIRRSSAASPGGPERSIYHVTEDGRRSFWAWARAPIAIMRDVRVEFPAKLYFLRKLDPAGVAGLLEAQLTSIDSMRDHLNDCQRVESDDPELNAAWKAFQSSTLDNFTDWIRSYRKSLAQHKGVLS